MLLEVRLQQALVLVVLVSELVPLLLELLHLKQRQSHSCVSCVNASHCFLSVCPAHTTTRYCYSVLLVLLRLLLVLVLLVLLVLLLLRCE
jgi:hypothetical protein